MMINGYGTLTRKVTTRLRASINMPFGTGSVVQDLVRALRMIGGGTYGCFKFLLRLQSLCGNLVMIAFLQEHCLGKEGWRFCLGAQIVGRRNQCVMPYFGALE